jgi:preprotein translocase subunit SecB
MADQPTPDQPGTADAADAPAPRITVEAQYIKDLSFENPQGPNAQAAIAQNPEVTIEVNTNARPLGEQDGVGRFEVTLLMRGEAKLKGAPVFIVELTYGGVIGLTNVPQEAVGPVLLIEGARLLFPFARNILAEVTRDGGFPPLFVQPIDFVALYRDQHARAVAQAQGQAPQGNGPAGTVGTA